MRATILQIAETGGWAGGETYLLELARRLDRQRFRLLIAVPEAGPLMDALGAEGIETVRLNLHPLGSPGPVLRLRRLLLETRPAIVQSQGARTNLYARLAGRWAGTPVIVSTVHNSLRDYPVSRLRKRLYLAADTATARLAHCTVCVADSHRRELLGRYDVPPNSVVTIPNGVDVMRFRPRPDDGALRRALSLPEEGPVIGLIGRMTPQKGHAVLLRALSTLIARKPDVRCLLVGDGELRRDLERLVHETGLAGHCRFLGVRKDLPEILPALDVVAIPSLSEGMPYVALEAMAAARAIVASAVNGLPELIQDGVTGRLVPPRDPDALARALGDLLSDPALRHRLGESARQIVETSFSIETWIGRIDALYDRLLNAHVGGGHA